MKSKSKPLWHLSVITDPQAEDAASELMAGMFDVPAVAWFDLESQTSRVSVFLEAGKFSAAGARAEISSGLARIRDCGLNVGPAKIEVARIKREDWAESWKRHFHPLTIGTQLLVKPSWSKKRPAKNQAVVILDPGLSFGTGQHPTTSFCLREIVRCHKTGAKQSFLDIGTGSGILAIAAAKLGYAPVRAFDFDPEAVRVAGENARKNRVAERVRLTRGDVTRLALRPRQQFDLVCANLISNLLIAERQRITNRLKPGGTLVLAGILAAEFTEVERAFADMKLQLRASRAENEWRSGSFCLA
jgi:ribosomal protein L11 methyltransferase